LFLTIVGITSGTHDRSIGEWLAPGKSKGMICPIRILTESRIY
jgi:hypothetical protein